MLWREVGRGNKEAEYYWNVKEWRRHHQRALEQRLGSVGLNLVDTWEKRVQAEGTARAKALRIGAC